MKRYLATVAAGITAALVLTTSGGTSVNSATPTTRIAVATTGGAIVLIDANGHRLATLTKPKHAGWTESDPAWSPDGTRIAFTRITNDRRSFGVYLMRADGSGVRRITSGRFDQRPAWSPDGRWIAYQSTDGLRLVHPDGTGVRLVPGSGRWAAWPAWTPSGRIAYTGASGWIFTSRLDGSDRRALVRGRDVRWSANGRLVVYTLPDGGLAVVGAQGGRPRLLGKGFEPDWSPDARRIVFTRWPSDTKLDVWVMRATGAGRHRIAPNASTPAWQPRHGGVYASP